ncbi:MAG: HGGxSTG domain-containing protein [Dongiaceae bacterium]
MTDAPANLSAADAASALAAAAGVADLAAAVEIETAEGDGLLAALVRHEIALGHQLSMQFAAAGNAALDVALAAGGDAAAAKAADRTAARLGGAVARVMGNVRLALLSSAARPDASEEQWIGVCFEGETLCSPAEAERRLAEAKAARARAQGAPVSRAGGDARAATPAEQERAAAGRAAAAELAAEAGVPALAAGAAEGDRVKLFLRHELAAAHRLVMRFGGRAGRLLAQARPEEDRVEALRLAFAAARLMARGRQALAALPRIGPGPNGGARIVAGYYWIGEHDMFANDAGIQAPVEVVEQSQVAFVGAGFKPARRAAAPMRAGLKPAPTVDGPTHLRRGRLRNGNPSGDYLSAPRCGACTRAGGRCRQPAMKNGRCRFHGGKSTGPRTAAGLARSRAARRTHGGYTAEIIDLRRAAASHARRVKALAAGLRQPAPRMALVIPLPGSSRGSLPGAERSLLAGHGVHPLFFMAPPHQRKAG